MANILQVNLCFLMDCTGSMQQWLNAAKNHIQTVIDDTRREFPLTEFRVMFVGYRDYSDEQRFIYMPLTTDIQFIRDSIGRVEAEGGDDTAEDVANGLLRAVQYMREAPAHSVRQIIHIADAPAHGLRYHRPTLSDRYPMGDPEGTDPLACIRRMVESGINYTFVKINDSTDMMIEAFHTSWGRDPGFQVVDLTPGQEPSLVYDDSPVGAGVVPPGDSPAFSRMLTASVSATIRHYTSSQAS